MSFKEYYKFYLSLHQNRWCRRFHALGQLATIIYVILCIVNTWTLALIASPLVVYPFAWTGHLAFEKNKPLAWKGVNDYGWTTLKAKACDWVMLKDILTGKIRW